MERPPGSPAMTGGTSIDIDVVGKALGGCEENCDFMLKAYRLILWLLQYLLKTLAPAKLCLSGFI